MSTRMRRLGRSVSPGLRPGRGQRAGHARPAGPGRPGPRGGPPLPLPARPRARATCAGRSARSSTASKAGLAAGQRAARRRRGTIESVGVDSWGVDYGLLDAGGRLLEDPVCYRDHRTDGAMEQVLRAGAARGDLPADRHPVPAVQHALPALRPRARGAARRSAAAADDPRPVPPRAVRLDAAASTRTPRRRSSSTCGRGGGPTTSSRASPCRARSCRRSLLPGTSLGELRPALQKELGLGPLRVLAPATHDTASAVAGTPLEPGWAYVSSGTWSLVGVERDRAPRERGRRAGQLHERGRRLRHGPLPEERDGPLDPRLLPAASGPRRGSSSGPRRPDRRRRRHRAPARAGLSRPPALLQPREHDRGAAGGARGDRAARAGRPRAAHAGSSSTRWPSATPRWCARSRA